MRSSINEILPLREDIDYVVPLVVFWWVFFELGF
jgi:hypothetical protein